MLPRTLAEALDAVEGDPLARATFGPDMHDAWLAFKRQEWLSYLNHVSDWEKDRYLQFF
jgi:glutamine synthetase